ncbi:MAG: GIY-YIG nuclease family protein [Candidatus Gastranaerophilales bacterium]
MEKDKKYYIYILLTQTNTYYCGYTDDVEKRFQAHLDGKGAKYTRANKPIKIVYSKEFDNKSDALKEERRIKNLKRKDKIALIEKYHSKF